VPCPQVRLSQDRLPIEISQVRGEDIGRYAATDHPTLFKAVIYTFKAVIYTF
jgi:hypothetical protein